MEHQQSLDIIINKIQLHCGSALQGIVLYGSRARGNYRSDSDFDLAMLCDHNIPADECWLLAQDIAATINKDVDLIDLWQAATVLRKEVIDGGVWLYQRDRIQCEEFATMAISQYQNFNLERRELLSAIKQRIQAFKQENDNG